MSSVRVQTGAIEPIEVLILDASLDPLTGKTDILLSVRRKHDGQWLDFNAPMAFKASGWTTRQLALTELDSTNAPGEYGYSLDLSAIGNMIANDTLEIRVDQSPGTDAANVPQVGEIKVGQFVDNIDAAISTKADPGDEMTLEDDAITAAKYDETTAYSLKQDDNGATSIARTGADADTLETISDQLDGVSTFDPATDEVDIGEVKGVAVAGVNDFKANVSGLSTFDPATDEVDIGEVKGVGVAGVDDFKADVSGLAIPGSEMNLVDNAVTAAKYDETTAYPLKSDDSGNTEVARTGADGDTLETISDQLDGVSTFDPTTDEVDIGEVKGVAVAGVNDFKANVSGLAIPGSEMNLVDNAITSAKYDETSAFPLKQDDTGTTLVARTGADGDTLETISDQLDGVSTFDPATDEVDIGEVKGVAVAGVNDFKADVAALALEANVEGHATDALNTYDPPTRGEATADKDEIVAEVNENEVKIDALQADMTAALADVTLLKNIETGRWKVDSVTHVLTCYHPVSGDPFLEFDLKGISGLPASVLVYERVPK